MNPKFSTTWKLTQSLSLLKDAQEKINSLTARRVRRSRGWDWREVSCTIVIERVKILTKLIGENPKSPKVAVSKIMIFYMGTKLNAENWHKHINFGSF